MNAQIEELITMSIIDGKISTEKLEIIKKKANALNIEEGELMIYIDHLLMKSKDSIQNQPSDLIKKGKEEATEYVNDIKEKLKDVNTEKELDLLNNEKGKVKTNFIPGFVEIGNLPYIVALIAVISTFLNWINVYTKTSVLGQEAGYDISFSGWYGGYGVTALIIFCVGAFLYSKGNKFWWIAGIIGFLDGIFIYSALTSSNVTMDIGEYGSASAGYKFLFGFYLYSASSILFSCLGLFKSINLNSASFNNSLSLFKQNLKQGKRSLIIGSLVAFVMYHIFDNSVLDAEESVIIAILLLTVQFVTLIPFLFFSKNHQTSFKYWGVFTLVFLIILNLWKADELNYIIFFPFAVLFTEHYEIIKEFATNQLNNFKESNKNDEFS